MGCHQLAFRWWKKAADLGDGGATLEVGYCYHHGIGTRQDIRAAVKAYDAAIRSRTITQHDQEEAMYHRAILLLQGNHSRNSRAEALELLRKAREDGDYPQAAAVLLSLESGDEMKLCECRRSLMPSLGGTKYCQLHRPKRTRRLNG